MYFFKRCIQGILIGAGAILPGISSGVFCVIFGIYEKLLDSILNFFKDKKNNIIFLLPILIGVLLGVFIFSNILNFLLYNYPLQTKSIFIGLILGSFPSLIKEANKEKNFKPYHILYTVIAFIIGFIGVLAEKNSNINFIFLNSSINIYYLFFSGFIMSARNNNPRCK